MKKCPECGSERIVKDVRVNDRVDMSNYTFQVSVDQDPDAIFFKERMFSTVRGEACADCGYLQFYAADPATLWQAYQNRRKDV